MSLDLAQSEIEAHSGVSYLPKQQYTMEPLVAYSEKRGVTPRVNSPVTLRKHSWRPRHDRGLTGGHVRLRRAVAEAYPLAGLGWTSQPFVFP